MKARGLLPIIHNISEEEIQATIDEYRKYDKLKLDTRTDEELRPFAVNTILNPPEKWTLEKLKEEAKKLDRYDPQ